MFSLVYDNIQLPTYDICMILMIQQTLAPLAVMDGAVIIIWDIGYCQSSLSFEQQKASLFYPSAITVVNTNSTHYIKKSPKRVQVKSGKIISTDHTG